MKTLRVGVIGAGSWTRLCHIPGVNSHSQATVTALCGRRYEPCRSQADEFGIPKVYTDYQDLVTDPDIDAVTISTPNAFHYPAALAALENGKHVFCEKPLAMDTKQARHLAQVAEKKGLVNHTAFTFRFLYGVNAAKRIAASGELGRIYQVRAYSEGGSGIDPQRPAEWRYQTSLAGSGQLGDMGSHLIDLVHYIVGDITSVTGSLQTLYRYRPGTGGTELCDADDHAALQFTCTTPDDPDGAAQGEVIASRIIPAQGRSFVQVMGTEGSLLCRYSRGEVDELQFAQRGTEFQPVEFGPDEVPHPGHALTKMLQAFVNAILGTPDPIAATFADGAKAQAVIDAAILSHTSGQRVSVVQGAEDSCQS